MPRPTGLSQRLRPDRVRATILEVLAAVGQEGQLADRALSRVLRRESGLWSGERRAVAETVYALLRNERSLELALERALVGAGAPRLEELPVSVADSARLAAWEARGGAAISGSVGLPHQVAAAISRVAEAWQQVRSEPRDPIEQLALLASLPRWIVERFIALLGETEAARLLDALNQRAPLTVRANLLKADRDGLAQSLADEGIGSTACRYSPWGLRLVDPVNAVGLRAFRAGGFELQDEGSQILALSCDARPRQLVVDCCAGAGGKTLALAATMRNKG
jgi:16S rRNA (cytosine967-C5)-methyltransferase